MDNQSAIIGFSPTLVASNAFSRRQSTCSIHKHRSISIISTNFGNLKPIDEYSHQEPLVEVPSKFNKSFHYVRFLVVFIGGFAVGFMSLLRLNITVAILSMVNQTQIFLRDKPEGDVLEYFGADYEETGEFDWDNEIQQMIISYYMIAYALPQLLTTKLAVRIGLRWSIPICVSICAMSCLLTPILAYYGWQYVMLMRLLNGLGASAILPVMVHLIEVWMPTGESPVGLAIVQFVQSILFTSSPMISGYLASYHWAWAFYAPAIAALVYCVIWLFVVSDSPADCWFISGNELDTICGCNKAAAAEEQDSSTKSPSSDSDDTKLSSKSDDPNCHHTQQVPWTRALRLRSFHALALVWILYNGSFGSLSFLIPIYIRQVLKVPVMENGLLCFVIQGGCMLSAIWPQPILRLLQSKLQLSVTWSRRIVIIVTITTLFAIASTHQNQVILFAINRVSQLSTDTLVTATIMSQYSKSRISSTIYSIINAIGSLSTVFFCMIVGKLLDISGQSEECWSWILIAMCLMTAVIMLLYLTLINSEPIEFESSSTKSSFPIEDGTPAKCCASRQVAA